MKIDTTMWEDKNRLRKRIKSLATMILSITAVNGFYMFSEKNWLLLGINILFFISTIFVFISYTKWEKNPPIIKK